MADLFHWMKSFVAVVENHGFSKAARQMHVSTPVITKHVQALENFSGKKLIIRTTKRIELTEIGLVYLDHVKKILKQINLAQEAIESFSKEPHGKITLGLPTAFQSMFFIKLLHKFLILYPKISINVISENDIQSLLNGKADLVINTFNLLEQQLIKDHLLTTNRSIYASPQYLKKYGCPQKVSELKQHNCIINLAVSPHSEWTFDKQKKVIVKGNYLTSSGIDVIFAGINGLGLIWVTDILVREEIRSKALVEVRLDLKPEDIHLYLYSKPAFVDSNIRLLKDFLIKESPYSVSSN